VAFNRERDRGDNSKGLRCDEPGLHEARTKQTPRAVDKDRLAICGDKVYEPKYYRDEVNCEIASGESESEEVERE
jgi:hypothetical protein